MKRSDHGTFHLIYATHVSAADFQEIKPDLDKVAEESRNLVLLLEGGLTLDDFYRHVDSSLRDLPPHVLLAPETVRANEKTLAAGYAAGVAELDRGYGKWNAGGAEQKRILNVNPFSEALLAWAAEHRVPIVREQIPFEAWIAIKGAFIPNIRANIAAASGDLATMWAENRNECEAYAREGLLRDAQVNGQVSKMLNVEHPNSNVVYVVGASHSMNEHLLVRDLNAVVHKTSIDLGIFWRYLEGFANGSLERTPKDVREEVEATMFLAGRVGLWGRANGELDDAFRIVYQISETAAAEKEVTLRRIVESMVAAPKFQDVARKLNVAELAKFIGWVFIRDSIENGVITSSEVGRYLDIKL